MEFNNYALIAFIAYVLIIFLIGILSSRFSSKGIGEFYLGGRQMNKFVVALSAVASGRSSWLLIGLTGMAYVQGISAIWAAVGYVIAEFLMFRYAAPKLRRHTALNDDITVSDFFESRFNDKSHALRLISAIIIIVFMTAYISAQFVGGGKAFSTSFNISMDSGVIITASIVLIYTLIGGFLAVSITDVLQAVFMLFALFVLPIIAIIHFSSFSEMLSIIELANPSSFDIFSIGTGAMLGFIGIGLGSPGNPHIHVRYMSINDPNELKFSAYIGTFWNALMAVCAVIIGVLGRAYFTSVNMINGSDPENLFPQLAELHLHPIIFGVIIASILAAVMSTADSMLLVCASAILRDIYQKIFNPDKIISEITLVRLSRIIIFAIVIISLLLGFIASDLVFWLVLFAWGGLGAAFGPTILLSLFWKGTTKNGVIAGFSSGVVTIIIWNQVASLRSIIYELVPAFFISLLFTFVISIWERKNQ